MTHRGLLAAAGVLLCVTGWVVAAQEPGSGQPPAADRVTTHRALAGSWSRADDVDKALGFPAAAAKEVPAALGVILDDKPGARWGEEQGEEIRAELDRLKHRLVATAQVRPGEKPAHEWIVTHHDGGTYACVVVPNLGLLTHRLALVPGATPDRDLLFVEWGVPDGGRRLVSAYRRGSK